MLDKPEKTHRLIDILNAAAPFDVELPRSLITHLQTQQMPITVKPMQSVSKVSYLGDEGGIVCHVVPDGHNALVISLTQVRVHRSLPFAAAVIDYQKHRLKKLKGRNKS